MKVGQVQFLRGCLGDEGFESLIKTIQREGYSIPTEMQEQYLAMMVVPHSLLAWVIATTKKLDEGENKEVEVPGHVGTKLLLNKVKSDIYTGYLHKDGQILHRFTGLSIPQLAGHLMTCLEMYDGVDSKIASSPKVVDGIAPLIDKLVRDRFSSPAPVINITINTGGAPAPKIEAPGFVTEPPVMAGPVAVEATAEESSSKKTKKDEFADANAARAKENATMTAAGYDPKTTSYPKFQEMQSINAQAAKVGPGSHTIIGGAEAPKAPEPPKMQAPTPPKAPEPPSMLDTPNFAKPNTNFMRDAKSNANSFLNQKAELAARSSCEAKKAEEYDPKKPKFKVGDRVRALHRPKEDRWGAKGKKIEGTIIHHDADEARMSPYTIEHGSEADGTYARQENKEHELELLDKPASKSELDLTALAAQIVDRAIKESKPKAFGLTLSKEEMEARCPDCGGSEFENEKFVGCMCMSSMQDCKVKVVKNEDGSYRLQFGKRWTSDDLKMLLDIIKRDSHE